jgi:hypothetical protein
MTFLDQKAKRGLRAAIAVGCGLALMCATVVGSTTTSIAAEHAAPPFIEGRVTALAIMSARHPTCVASMLARVSSDRCPGGPAASLRQPLYSRTYVP